jgi:hypothetical protein
MDDTQISFLHSDEDEQVFDSQPEVPTNTSPSSPSFQYDPSSPTTSVNTTVGAFDISLPIGDQLEQQSPSLAPLLRRDEPGQKVPPADDTNESSDEGLSALTRSSSSSLAHATESSDDNIYKTESSEESSDDTSRSHATMASAASSSSSSPPTSDTSNIPTPGPAIGARDTIQPKLLIPTSPPGPSIGSRDARYAYLLTYSQADLDKFPSAAAFADPIKTAFNKCNAQVERWVASKERHEQTGGYHYHMAILLAKQKRWKKIKEEIYNTLGISPHFSGKHAGYASAYRYVTKCAPEEDIAHSEGHVYMGPIRENDPAYLGMQSNVKKTAAKRSSAGATGQDEGEAKKKKPQARDLRHKDIAKMVVDHRIESLQHLQRIAELRRVAGEYDLFTYLAVRKAKDTEELIRNCWEIQSAPGRADTIKLPRTMVLQNTAAGECVDSCNGRWREMAEQILEWNEKVDNNEFKRAIYENLQLGRSKGSSVFLIGPTDCGKSFLLLPLKTVYTTFANPTQDRYAWIGVDLADVIFLNDFRWSSSLIPWDDLLRLLAGEQVQFARPKNLYATNIILSSDNTIPVFGTGMKKNQWKGAYQATSELENEQMDRRIKYFEFSHQISKQTVQRGAKPCAKCFAQFILSGLD